MRMKANWIKTVTTRENPIVSRPNQKPNTNKPELGRATLFIWTYGIKCKTNSLIAQSIGTRYLQGGPSGCSRWKLRRERLADSKLLNQLSGRTETDCWIACG